jgi:hypothetical protein
MSENIILFDKCVALILDTLYQNFPIETYIKCSNFVEFDAEDKSEVFFSTMRFLKKENFIIFSEQVYGGFIGVVLTTKGLGLLQAVPKSLKEPFFSQIKKAIKSGSNLLISEVIKQFISYSVEHIKA